MSLERGVIEIEGQDAVRAARGTLNPADKAIIAAAAMPRDRGAVKLQGFLKDGSADCTAVHAQTGATALHKACMKANSACVALLCSAGWSLLQLDGMNRTPLHMLATQNIAPLRKCLWAFPPAALAAALLARDSSATAPLGVTLARLLQLATSVDPTNLDAKTPGMYELAAFTIQVVGHARGGALCPPSLLQHPPPGSYRPAFVSSQAAEVFAVPPGTHPPQIDFAVMMKLSRVAEPADLLRCLFWLHAPLEYTPCVLLSPPSSASLAAPAASPQPAASPAEADGNTSDSFDEESRAPSAPPSRAGHPPPAATAQPQGERLADGWTAHAIWWGHLIPERGVRGFALGADLAAGAVSGVLAAQEGGGARAPPAAERLLGKLLSTHITWALRRTVVLSRRARRADSSPRAAAVKGPQEM